MRHVIVIFSILQLKGAKKRFQILLSLNDSIIVESRSESLNCSVMQYEYITVKYDICRTIKFQVHLRIFLQV